MAQLNTWILALNPVAGRLMASRKLPSGYPHLCLPTRLRVWILTLIRSDESVIPFLQTSHLYCKLLIVS